MRNYVIALYIRLSVEDFKTESLSIPNQKLILREKAMSLPEWDNSEILEFIDNGHTGTNFERPAVQELLTMVQAGKINCIIVKDLSRFGRNSIETGYFMSGYFLFTTPVLFPSVMILTRLISKVIPEGLILLSSILLASVIAGICP